MKKQLVPIIIFVFSGLILILGIWQLVLFIPPQMDMLDQATVQGAPAEQVSEYYWQQFIPQVLNYVITALGISSILFAAGMLYVKRDTKEVANHQHMSRPAQTNRSDDGELDDFFEGFEAVEDERKSE